MSTEKHNSDDIISQAITSVPEALKPNISEIQKATGLSRNTIGSSFKRIWSNVVIRFITPSEVSPNIERALIGIKLLDSKMDSIERVSIDLIRSDYVCSVLVVEGPEIDIFVKVVAPGGALLRDELFRIKELDGVSNAYVICRILRESRIGYSEYAMIKDYTNLR